MSVRLDDNRFFIILECLFGLSGMLLFFSSFVISWHIGFLDVVILLLSIWVLARGVNIVDLALLLWPGVVFYVLENRAISVSDVLLGTDVPFVILPLAGVWCGMALRRIQDIGSATIILALSLPIGLAYTNGHILATGVLIVSLYLFGYLSSLYWMVMRETEVSFLELILLYLGLFISVFC